MNKVRGYCKHAKKSVRNPHANGCGGVAFWFTRFGKAWFDMNFSEILFADSDGNPTGQVKWLNKPVEDYNCSDCGARLHGKDLQHVAVIQDDQAEALHREEHAKVSVGELCEFCGKRKEFEAIR